MRDVLILNSAAQMKALSDAKRLEILKLLIHDPLSPLELGKALGEPRRSLYYHLGEMERHGLIEVVETRQRRNMIEKIYRATALFYTVDWGLFERDDLSDAFTDSVTSVLETAAVELRRLVRSEAWGPELAVRTTHVHRLLEVPPERQAEFGAKLAAFYDDFSPTKGGKTPEHPMLWTLVAMPKVS